MTHTIVNRAIVTAVAASALVLTSAGACGPAGEDDSPGVTQQDVEDDD